MSDVYIDQTPVDIVEVVTAAYTIIEISGPDAAGLVEVDESDAVFTIVEQPGVETLQIVTPGPIGPRGPIGPQGPQGPFAPVFEQHFASPEMVWVIVHNMDLYPVVTLYDENHEEITGDVMTPDRNTVIVTFVVPFAGTARLKG
jgi:hypothetical protein